MRPRVLDTSAIIALHEAYPPVFDMLTAAGVGRYNMILPAAALAEANTQVKASFDAWEPVLLTPGLEVNSLASHIAIEICDMPGDVATRHTVYEARAARGVIITCPTVVGRGTCRAPAVSRGEQPRSNPPCAWCSCEHESETSAAERG